MQEFDVDIDKLIRGVTKSLDALKRAKELEGALKDVRKKVDRLEDSSKEFAKCKPVVDEKTFTARKSKLEELAKVCGEAETAVDDLLKREVYSSESDRKPSGGVEVPDLPKGKKKPTVADLPNVGSQLDDLAKKIKETNTKVKSDIDGFKAWYKAGSKEDSIECKVPKGVTNMVELCDRKGCITLPDEQPFEATITFDGINRQTVENELKNFQTEFFGEIGKELEPLKKQVAASFKKWNSDFEEIERTFDKRAGTDLFKCINKYFKTDLPKFIEDRLETAARRALNDALKGSVAAKRATIKVQANYNSFAEFEVTFPEKPDGLGKSFKDADSAVSSLTESATEIAEGYGEVQESARKLQSALAKGDKSVQSKDLNKAISRLQGGVDDADAARQSLFEHLGPVNKKLSENKDVLKEDKDVKYDELSQGLSATLRELKGGGGAISHELKHLTETADAAKKLLTTFDSLYGKGGEAPDQKKADTFKQDFDKFVKSLTDKPADFKKKLEISLDLALLKTVSEKFK